MRICLNTATARESEHQKVEIRPGAPPEYDLLVAQQLTIEGRTAEAVDAYLRAVEKDPDSAYLHRKAAVALAQHNRIEESLVHGQRAVELDPGDEPSRLFLGQLYRVRRQTGDAERVLTERPGEPRSPNSAFLLYQVYLDAGRYDDALATAEWLARNEPTELRGRMAVAAVYQRMERHAEAEAALREARGIDRRRSAAIVHGDRHVAQWLEHHLDTVGVGGSIPPVPTMMMDDGRSNTDDARWADELAR